MQGADLTQQAVDAVADAQEVLLRLEVHVGGIALDGIGEDGVDQAHHRLAVLVAGGGEAAPVDLAGLDLVQDAVDRQLVAIVLIDGAGDLRLAGQHRVDLQIVVGQCAQLVQRDDVVHVGDGHRHAVPGAVVVEWQQAVALGEFLRHQAQRAGVDDGAGEVDAFLAEAFAERVAQRRLGDEAQADQQLADRLVGLHLLQQRDAQLILADDSLRDQDLAERPAMRCGRIHLHGAGQGAGYFCNSLTRPATWFLSKAAGRWAAAASAP
ncbi:MAG: hypothetical protein MOGDAGHF_00629 [Rhodocyclaceae bacterium]|nr:hypothetical protein [Rhodocyclaceae bacterium]